MPYADPDEKDVHHIRFKSPQERGQELAISLHNHFLPRIYDVVTEARRCSSRLTRATKTASRSGLWARARRGRPAFFAKQRVLKRDGVYPRYAQATVDQDVFMNEGKYDAFEEAHIDDYATARNPPQGFLEQVRPDVEEIGWARGRLLGEGEVQRQRRCFNQMVMSRTWAHLSNWRGAVKDVLENCGGEDKNAGTCADDNKRFVLNGLEGLFEEQPMEFRSSEALAEWLVAAESLETESWGRPSS